MSLTERGGVPVPEAASSPTSLPDALDWRARSWMFGPATGRWSLPVIDVGLGVLLLLFALAGIDLLLRFGPYAVYIANVVLCMFVAVVQIGRRRWRRTSFVLTAVGLACYAMLTLISPVSIGVSPVILAALGTVHAMTRWEPSAAWRRSCWAVAAVGAFFYPLTLTQLEQPVNLVYVAAVAVLCLAAILLVTLDALRQRPRVEHTLDEADRTRAAAVAQERLQIARELHDMVGHGLTAVKVQAATALAVDDPDTVRDMLTNIHRTADSSLGEVRDLVRVLRTPATAEVSADLRGITDAIDTASDAGLDLRADVPDAETLEAYNQSWSVLSRLAVVRVVQEGLTNAMRHGAGDATVSVEVADECRITVTNTVQPGAAPPSTPGNGLAGLRERVALQGGTLDVRDTDEHFILEARIPLRDTRENEHD